MSVSDRNASIVNKTKKLLKEYGYEIKLNHLYNVFSKLSDESSWNVAKSKGIEFKNIIKNQSDLIIQGNSFEKDIVITASHVNQILHRMTKTLYFYLEMNSEHEYRPNHLLNTFTKSSKVAKGKSKVIEYINILHAEFDRRRLFSISSIENFNPIMIYFDGYFELFKNSSNQELNNKILDLFRYGSSVGFTIYSAPTSRATQSDFPAFDIKHRILVKKDLFVIDKKSPSLHFVKDSNLKINFIGSHSKVSESGSEDSIINAIIHPEILTRLVNYDPNTFKFHCAELTLKILE